MHPLDMSLSQATAPPTTPQRVPIRSAPDVAGVLLACALLGAMAVGLLLNGYYCYVLAVNQFASGKAMWFWSDAFVRIVLCLHMGSAAILILAKRRAGKCMLFTWSLAYLVWVPISAVVAVRTGEPSLDVLLAVGITALLPSVPFVALLAGGCIWLLLPLLALSWLLRVSIKHTEFSSMPISPDSGIHD